MPILLKSANRGLHARHSIANRLLPHAWLILLYACALPLAGSLR